MPKRERSFVISAEHAARADEWIKTHGCKLRRSKRTTAIGGKITYKFTDTSIGQIQTVLCACGKDECLNWDVL
jgi:hypothetical protein